MTVSDEEAKDVRTAPGHARPQPATPTGPLGGDPALIGVPTFIVGSIALGLTLVGYVPAGAVGAPVAIILVATGLGQLIAAVWAAGLGQNAVAAIFGIFTGFWSSYAVLVLGLTHNWFGIAENAATRTQALFLISWLVTIVILTLATLRLPSAFTLLFVLIDTALAVVLLATLNGSTSLQIIGGYTVFAFVAVGVYLFFHVASLPPAGVDCRSGVRRWVVEVWLQASLFIGVERVITQLCRGVRHPRLRFAGGQRIRRQVTHPRLKAISAPLQGAMVRE
jgi:succinate-acetate transporter protein